MPMLLFNLTNMLVNMIHNLDLVVMVIFIIDLQMVLLLQHHHHGDNWHGMMKN